MEASRQFAVEAARLAQHTRCHNIVILEMASVCPVTDYFVIATGTSARQMRTVCDEINELAAKMNFKCFRRSGYEGESWIAADYIDVVLHVFEAGARQYYELENLWGDAKRVSF
ncbi:MAG: ribosome silencing factor [Tepidisphaeraceae bacterium]